MTDSEQILERLRELQKIKPYLTYVQYEDKGMLCIVQNETSSHVMLYSLEDIKDENAKDRFLELGAEWWFESNNETPIDSFLGDKFNEFRPLLKGLSKKLITNMIGPRLNMSEIYKKRIKKRKVEMVRHPKD